MIHIFWEQHGDAVIFGLILFAAYVVLLAAALRKQRGIYARKLARVRTALRRARNRRFVEATSLQGPSPNGPVHRAGAWTAAINAEFDALMRTAFTDGGES